MRNTAKLNWLPTVTLFLFLLQLLLFPMAIEAAHSGGSETPGHVLTYTTGRLTWDSGTAVGENGVAELRLFDTVYQNVQSENDGRVVAPGTERLDVVRLQNATDRMIRYIAILYVEEEEPDLPVAPILTGDGFTDTGAYPLPEGVEEDQVVRAVTGTVRGGEYQDFDLSWYWNDDDGAEWDQMDTALGNWAPFAEANDVTAGFYVVVVEDFADSDDSRETDAAGTPSCITPEVPKTGG